MFTQALFALLHVLVLVYWLGGDLGAFYSSRFLTAEGVSPDRRLMAASIVGNVDMAPRSALILALPTGMALANAKGWIGIGWDLVLVATAVALLWLILAWYLHWQEGQPALWTRRLDLLLRWLLILTTSAWAVLGLLGAISLPFFLALKLLALGACVVLGLQIRRVLAPLGAALGNLNQPSSEQDPEKVIATSLASARPLVLCIWGLLIFSAFIGLWTPAAF